MLDTLRAAPPVFCKVTVCDELATSMPWSPKLRLVAERLTAGLPLVFEPVPERLTSCGLPLALSVMLTSALNDPTALGEKVTLIVQVALTSILVPQLLLSENSLGFVPVNAILEKSKDAVPVSFMVIVWTADLVPSSSLPKARLVDDKVTAGAAAIPVPDREMVSVEQPEAQLRDTLPVTLPVDAGSNLTVNAVLPSTPRVRGSVNPVMLNPDPVTVAVEIWASAVPELVRVTECVTLIPSVSSPKLILEGLALTSASPVPVPERLTSCGLPLALSVMLRSALNDSTALGEKVTLMVQLAPAAISAPQLLLSVKSLG